MICLLPYSRHHFLVIVWKISPKMLYWRFQNKAFPKKPPLPTKAVFSSFFLLARIFFPNFLRPFYALIYTKLNDSQCVESVRIWSFSGLYFPTFGLILRFSLTAMQTRENPDQKNSEYGHLSRSVCGVYILRTS